MLQFLKYVLATIVGLLLFFIISVFIMVGIGSAFSGMNNVVLQDNSVFKLDLSNPIREVGEENPLADIGGPFSGNENVIGLKDIKSAILIAKNNSNIKGIYLKVDAPTAGWATLEEIRNALLDFKKSKKFIYAYSETYTEKGYYLASVAEQIYLNPMGGMEWNGLTAEYEFYKGTFEKLDIKPEVFRVGEFKSAVEPFLRKDMSEASKTQSRELLGAINNHYLNQISASRNIPVAKLLNLADSLSVENTKSALQNKLITHAGYYDEFESTIKAKLKVDAKKSIEFIGLDKLNKTETNTPDGDFNKRVAVIIAEGEIVSGDGGNGMVGSDKFVKDLKKLREDDKVKAIVIRINSPGGSALASDVMWREIGLTKKVKPVIASMSDVAASGGYYMAMGTQYIFAQPNTITGSIGIFGLMFNLQDFFNNKLGITFDRVNTNAHADFPSGTRPMSDFERSRIQQSVNEGYAAFTSKAAQGRKMDLEKLKSLAGGRVWSGVQAKANGLVDSLGGIDEAIAFAASQAKMKEGEYRVRYYPEKKNMIDDFVEKLTSNKEEQALNKSLGTLAPYAKSYKKIINMQGLQTRLPFEMSIR